MYTDVGVINVPGVLMTDANAQEDYYEDEYADGGDDGGDPAGAEASGHPHRHQHQRLHHNGHATGQERHEGDRERLAQPGDLRARIEAAKRSKAQKDRCEPCDEHKSVSMQALVL